MSDSTTEAQLPAGLVYQWMQDLEYLTAHPPGWLLCERGSSLGRDWWYPTQEAALAALAALTASGWQVDAAAGRATYQALDYDCRQRVWQADCDPLVAWVCPTTGFPVDRVEPAKANPPQKEAGHLWWYQHEAGEIAR